MLYSFKSRNVHPHFAALFFFLSCWVVPSFARAEGVSSLVARAESAQLWTNGYWRTLVHYEPSLLGGYKSRIDDPAFFLAADGKHNPRAELVATLQAFFAPLGTNERTHAVCTFPARLHWLKQQLAWDGSGLPQQECEKFREVYNYLNPTSVALVYPAAYMNSPASMFGHTMIVFDAKEKNRLLSQALTYAAQTGQGFGPLFAFAGILGFYKGYYAAMPYYEKVEEYTAIGHRDVWEYEFDFTQDEITQMLRHAWELQNIFSYYYFFTENCSYNLFYLIDAARPELRTTSFNRPFVIPIDTVKYIDSLGIIRAKTYRPSQVSRIRHLESELTPPVRQLALAIAHGQTNAAAAAASITNREEKVRMMDFASEYTQYLYTAKKITPEQYRPLFINVLKTRSQLGASEDVASRVPVPDRPEDGHAPAKVAAGAGVQNGEFFSSLYYRPAYHSTLDNDSGFTRGAQIQFLNLELRHYPERDRVELQNVDIVEVDSLAARDDLFQPFSWRVKAGLTQSERVKKQDRLMAHLNTAAGGTWYTGKNGVWFALFEAVAQAGQDFDQGYALGAGPSLGLIQSITRDWKVVLQGRSLYMGIGDDFWTQRVSLDQDFKLQRNLSLSCHLIHQRMDTTETDEAQLRLNFYF